MLIYSGTNTLPGAHGLELTRRVGRRIAVKVLRALVSD
jgi:hypothetical protein